MMVRYVDIGRGVLSLLPVMFFCACSTVQTASNRPDIILITTDDMSYLDVQEYACRITGEKKRRMINETPNLDRLCKEGLNFEEAYAGRLYSGERSGLLTGRINGVLGTDGMSQSISFNRMFPGYHSAIIGAWHSEGTPEDIGFVRYSSDKKGHGTISGLTDDVLGFIEERTGRHSEPYFLCVNFSSEDGMSAVKEKNLKHFTEKCGKGLKGRNDSRHAAMIKELDDAVGKILHKVWRNGLEKDTVVVFMPTLKHNSVVTDNCRVPLIIRWKGHVKPDSWSKVAVDYADILPTMMNCAGFFPESLSEETAVDGCSLSGLFFDARNQWESYDRDDRPRRISGV